MARRARRSAVLDARMVPDATWRGRLGISHEDLLRFCERWRRAEFALFGSILRDDFDAESDIDVLIDFAPGARPAPADMAVLQRELAELAGRPVEITTRGALESSRNPIRRAHILANMRSHYAA